METKTWIHNCNVYQQMPIAHSHLWQCRTKGGWLHLVVANDQHYQTSPISWPTLWRHVRYAQLYIGLYTQTKHGKDWLTAWFSEWCSHGCFLGWYSVARTLRHALSLGGCLIISLSTLGICKLYAHGSVSSLPCCWWGCSVITLPSLCNITA